MSLRAARLIALSTIVSCAGSQPAVVAPAAPAHSEEVVLPSAPISSAPAPSSPPDPEMMPHPVPVVLRARRYFDSNAARVIETPVAIIVAGGLIVDIGKPEVVRVPAGAQTIDLGDVTLLPGFIDSHTHVTQEMSENYYRDQYEGLLRFPAEQAHYAALYARRLLDAGFTTVRDLGSSDLLDVGLRNAIAKDVVTGPRMLVAVHGIGATGGHADSDPFPAERVTASGRMEGICNGPDDCRATVRMQVKYGADVIKVMASGGVLSVADAVDTEQLTPAELAAIVDEAHRLHRKVAAHCHGDMAAKAAITAGVDSIEHGSFLKPDTLALMKARRVVLVPTMLAGEYTGHKLEKFPPAIQVKAARALAAHTQMFKDALRIGVTIAFGTDSAVSPHGINAQEFSLMTSQGMAPAEALRAATLVDAELLGIAAQTGSLDKGKLADIVAVPGNPVVDIHQTEHVVFVMRAGRIYKQPGLEELDHRTLK